MSDPIVLEIKGLDRIIAGLEKFPRQIIRYMQAAGRESGSEVIMTQGLKQYPPEGEGNREPYPFYIRGRGTQTSPGRNDRRSERYGTQFHVEPSGYGVIIGNRASYAPYLAGEYEQSRKAAIIGWRRLIDVARQKIAIIEQIYQRFVDRAILDLDL